MATDEPPVSGMPQLQLPDVKLPGGVIVTPPKAEIVNYPALVAIGVTVIGSVILLLFASRFDHTKGALTISLLIVLAVVGVLAYSVTVTVPRDETTAAVIGALTAAFGGVITYWLKNRSNGNGSNGNGKP